MDLGSLQEPFLEAVDPVVVFGGEDEDNSLEAFVVREGELVRVPHFEEVRFGRTLSQDRFLQINSVTCI